jgi:small subunit ribosomal protein S5
MIKRPSKMREKRWSVGKPEAEVKEEGFEERVLEVNRVSRTVAGGKRMRFRSLVIVGDRKGQVGLGLGKSNEAAAAIAKAGAKAKKHLIQVPLHEGTLPMPIEEKYGSSLIILRPARPGTSIIAGGAVRTVLELAGYENAVAKIVGASNPITTARATFAALSRLSKMWEEKR